MTKPRQKDQVSSRRELSPHIIYELQRILAPAEVYALGQIPEEIRQLEEILGATFPLEPTQWLGVEVMPPLVTRPDVSLPVKKAVERIGKTAQYWKLFCEAVQAGRVVANMSASALIIWHDGSITVEGDKVRLIDSTGDGGFWKYDPEHAIFPLSVEVPHKNKREKFVSVDVDRGELGISHEQSMRTWLAQKELLNVMDEVYMESVRDLIHSKQFPESVLSLYQHQPLPEKAYKFVTLLFLEGLELEVIVQAREQVEQRVRERIVQHKGDEKLQAAAREFMEAFHDMWQTALAFVR